MARIPNETPLGFLGNLSREQERRLLQLWSLVLHLENPASFALFEQIFRVNGTDWDASSSSTSSFSRRKSVLARTDSIVARRTRPTSTASFSTPTTPLALSLRSIGLTPSEIRSISRCMIHLTPADVRWGMLTAAKHESPDRWILRYLRFCRWNIGKAFVQILEALRWRMKEMHVDDHLLPEGDSFALQQAQASPLSADAQLASEFLDQLRMGKLFVHGVDRMNRPVCVVCVRLHRPEDQSQEALNRAIVHLIESVRLLIAPPVETMTVVFDMTGFTLGNMEYAAVKFIIRCFELYYPESLGVLLIHNAPRIFAGIWKVIKGWIDPVAKTRIHFTKTVEDLARFIHPSQILNELGGDEEWEYEYIEPEMDEDYMMDDDDTRDALLTERQEISEEFFSLTAQWIKATGANDLEEIAIVKSRRTEVIEQLRRNYWKLDPYVRARNCLDRTGVIQDGGRIEHYPSLKAQVQIETAKVLQVAHIDRARVRLINV